ncbi:MAG TPA: MaoC family dehydratase [Beijerinckiaceae bacterium]|jgi:acyl dehydratase|nr:MaoC family dehydratase [Beijerinckiaceae bacterium]
MLAVGHRFPDCRLGPIASAQVTAYAAASGDDNPLHTDIECARSFGFSAPLVHGLLLMGLFQSACRCWGLGGTIAQMETRFVSPVMQGTELRYCGNVAAADAEGVRIRIVVRNADNVLCLVGSLLLRAEDAGRAASTEHTAASRDERSDQG